MLINIGTALKLIDVIYNITNLSYLAEIVISLLTKHFAIG